MSVMGDHSDADDNGDGEGVWSPDIEKCFREALVLFPPCGRRKHILQEEGGKMYGRNELIARYIRMQTGKVRSRKQVSSHIQVLARRKAKAESNGSLTGSNADLNSGSSSTSSPPARLSQLNSLSLSEPRNQQVAQANPFCDVWADRSIVTSKIRLVEFSAFIEQRQLAQHNGLLLPVYEPPPNQINSPLMAATNLSQLALAQQLNRASPLQGHPSLPQQPQPQNPSQQLPFNINQQHHQQMNTSANPLITNHHHHHQQHHHPPVTNSGGFTRHSYVKIDYRVPIYRQLNKLERISIDQIQDKFPENPGLEALYQRGPSDAFYLVKFWADINNDFEYNIDDQNSFFGFSCHFETIEPFRSITCSTKACSYGSQVVEKVEKIYAAFNSTNGRYTYNIDRSPMCEFMTQFIKKLRQLPDLTLMNRILENFTVLQLVTSETDILLCIAYVFEIGLSQRGSHHHVYKLTKIHDS